MLHKFSWNSRITFIFYITVGRRGCDTTSAHSPFPGERGKESEACDSPT
ncbi:unnamed protein product [Amoebophrya sp. A25]|nr:unnamed protein product [Amoebophrya sp. A25]|eukprot:GSA25T00023639001.1